VLHELVASADHGGFVFWFLVEVIVVARIITLLYYLLLGKCLSCSLLGSSELVKNPLLLLL